MATKEILESRINNGNNDTFRDLYGNDVTELKRNAERYLKLLGQFTAEFGAKDAEFFSSPGRTEIGGNHTDHNWGRVLAGAVNLDNVAVAGPNGTNIIRILSEGYPRFEVDLSSLAPVDNERFTSAALVRGICSRFKELGFDIGGFDACIDGGVPKGSGLSSSASFEVLVGAILNRLFNNDRMDPIQNAIIGQ
ncbi:MAG TPA: galactokinase family protein, partial [Bacteroidales bacterium]|nr:galactokinase family protein [Bacteroidales bacterium]